MLIRRRSGGTTDCTVDSTRSPTRISPPSGLSRPAISRRVVVLPQPDGPSSDTNSPLSTARLSPLTAPKSPNRLCKLSSRRKPIGGGLLTNAQVALADHPRHKPDHAQRQHQQHNAHHSRRLQLADRVHVVDLDRDD